MPIQLITQFRAKPGQALELLRLIMGIVSGERTPGCLEGSVLQNQDEPDDIIMQQRWQSRQQADAWRAHVQSLAAIRALTAEPIRLRCFEVLDMADAAQWAPGSVTAQSASSPAPGEIPKVSTPDALGG